MYWSRSIPLSWTLLLLNSVVDCQDEIPETDNPECISEAKSERLEILANLLDLKSSVGFLLESISDLDRRVRSIEFVVRDAEAKRTKKIDGLKRQPQVLTRKVTADGAESQNLEARMSSKLLSLDQKINSTIFLIRGMEEPLAEIRNQTQALLEESREENRNGSGATEGVAPTLQTLDNPRNLTNTQADNKTGTLLTGGKRTAKIEMILKNPKAKFFMGENLAGGAVNYDSINTSYPGGCHSVNGIKSMQTSESCVRVFQGNWCQGMSRALYPKAISRSFINFLTSELSAVYSVGPCLPNEFQYASVSLNGSEVAITKDESNVHQVPDIVDDFLGYKEYYSKSTSVGSSRNSVTHYYMDGKGRPKWIQAVVYKRHINDNAGLAVQGLAIPPGLGGPMNETYNSFPQTLRHFEEWKQITDAIRYNKRPSDYLRDEAYLTFVYESPEMTKPYGFYYWVVVRIPGSKTNVVYGFIEN